MVVLFLAITLLSSFGLHAIQIKHDHPGHPLEHSSAPHHGDQAITIAEYIHGADKKFISALIAATMIIGTFVLSERTWRLSSALLQTRLKTLVRKNFKIRDIEQRLYVYLFSEGILNPKNH